MKVGEALNVIGGLSTPSKMPGRAFGFSAQRCITGSKLRKVAGSVCNDCYACKGFYAIMPSVKTAHARRYRKLARALRDGEYRARYIAAFTRALARQSWFRWHDSGDLQSVAHLELIADIATATPHVRHWLPTREYRMVRQYLERHIAPANLNIRVSAHMVNQTLPDAAVPTGCTASAVYTHDAPGYACPARSQGNQCRDCRACWSRDVPLVTYAKH